MFEANQNEMNFAKMKHNIISAAAALLSALILVQALGATVSADGSGEATEAPAPGISYAPPARKIVFPDVASDDWFYDDVMTLVSDGILNGYPDGSFRPELDVTNAEFIKMIVAAVGGAEGARAMFPESWASGYITAAYERGIITDEDLTGGFSPDKPITRSAMTKMIVLALGIEPARIDDPFTDISDMYASTAYNEYLLRGYPDGNGGRVYNGAGNASRSEAASMTVRLIEYAKDPYAFRRDAVLENASNNVLGSEFELIDLFYSLNSAYRKNAVWLLNDSTMKNIRKLKDSNGQYLWQPALHEGGFDTLLGKRIYTSPYAPELAADQKTVAFGDFNYYWIGDRLGITFKRLNERFAETGQIGFIASKRLDGKLILPEAIKVLQQKGSASSGG